jgi:pyridinium-3,5-biscarboxylic acid mononucleotide synthase
MRETEIYELLNSVKNGKIEIQDAVDKLKTLPYDDLEFAKIDNHREIRKGFPEVIYCQGKTIPQIKGIITKMMEHKNNIMATRANQEVFDSLKNDFKSIEYYSEARIMFIKNKEIPVSKNKILVVTGGTSDIPVAEEAAVTAEKLGNSVERLFDVGVAGLHRLLNNLKKLDEASVIIAVAGMEGALASVVGGLVDKPVIAVPTSIGYGASFGGLAALLAMLNSCASGIGVVNIDNGFGAGYLASVINRQLEKACEKK